MRTLTKKQKKILDNYQDCRDVSELPYEVYQQLEEINDTEILHQEIDRYLWDNYKGSFVKSLW